MLIVRDNSHRKRLCLPRKIQSFVSRRAKCKNLEGQLVSDKDYEADENEEALATLRNEVLEYIQPKHPVMYDGYNLCDLVTSQKLTKLKISKLSEICRSFKLEVLAPFFGGLAVFLLPLNHVFCEPMKYEMHYYCNNLQSNLS